MAKRRYTTRAEDAAFLLDAFADLRRTWKVGDVCRPYRGTEPTTVIKLDGDAVYLANGESLHVSRMRSVKESS